MTHALSSYYPSTIRVQMDEQDVFTIEAGIVVHSIQLPQEYQPAKLNIYFHQELVYSLDRMQGVLVDLYLMKQLLSISLLNQSIDQLNSWSSVL